MIVDELIRAGPQGEIATERAVQRQNHENDQPDEGRQQHDLNAL